mgnify:CR=1 FL=1
MYNLRELGDYFKQRLQDRLLHLAGRKPAKKRNPISLSSAGRCQRASAYAILGADQLVWGWRQKVSLEDGNYTHTQVRKYLKSALKGTHFSLDDQEMPVYLNVSGWKIAGHVDGIITRLCDCVEHKELPRKVVLEVKSTGQYGYYKSLKKGGISIEYRSQATAYMMGAGVTDTLFMFKNKNNGEIAFVHYKLDDTLAKSIDDRYRNVKLFKEGFRQIDDMTREYGPNKKGQLPFQCNYCPFVLKCWKEFKPGRSEPGKAVYQLDAFDKEYPEIVSYPDQGDS